MKAIRKPKELEELVNFSFKIPPSGMVTHTPITGQSRFLKSLGSDCRLAMKYSIKLDICSFVIEGVQYVVPVFSGIRSILENAGFTESIFSVPFTNSDIPVVGSNKWYNMKEQVLRWNVHDARKTCREYSKAKGLLPLYDGVIMDSQEILFSGLLVSKLGCHLHVYPNLNGTSFSAETPSDVSAKVLNLLGTFSCSNGFCLINAEDGRSYVTEDSKKLQEWLCRLGYRKEKLPVPLSNGEELI